MTPAPGNTNGGAFDVAQLCCRAFLFRSQLTICFSYDDACRHSVSAKGLGSMWPPNEAQVVTLVSSSAARRPRASHLDLELNNLV